MAYRAPLQDMRFVLRHTADLEDLSRLPGYAHATPDVADAVLDEAARLAEGVWAPLNAVGDRQPAKLADGAVVTPPGFSDAYRQYVAGGWNALTASLHFGGQNLPRALGMAVGEMWQSANLSLSLCMLLGQGAIEAIEHHGTEEQKRLYLPKLVSGEWAGTMNLTEPQAGTDLAAIRAVARKSGGHYLLKGQKIFITYGDHDFTPNIIHLVLARIEGLPEGNDGLGLFIVPKFLLNPDGSPGARNDLKAVSLEHKLGLHGSPTCVMAYGEHDGAVAYLVGEEGKGLRNMFTMMNNARLAVGLQGVALSERAYQHALAYARDRVQGFRLGDKSGKRVAIIEHADVRRMLLTIKATTEATRALAYYQGAMIDRAQAAGDKDAAARVELLTPLVKAWATDMAVENASLGVQIHGGMGFIEETGAAQFYRDARITPIYEGTNGIQALDLVFRKVLRDGGAEAGRFVAEMKALIPALTAAPGDDLGAIAAGLRQAVAALEETTSWMLANAKSDGDALAAGAVPYLRLFATVAGAYLLARQALAAQQALFSDGGAAAFYNAKLVTARFFAEALLPQVHGLKGPAMGGCRTAAQIANDQF